MNGVKLFIQNNPSFVYERDFKGRTSINYAAVHNQL